MKFSVARPALVAVFAVFALCALLAMAGCLSEKPERQDAAPAPARPAPPVLVQRLARADIPLTHTFVGHVEGVHAAEVRAQVGGILKKRLYREGAKVQAGQVLFEINPAPYQAVVDQAVGRVTSIRARLANAKRDLDRAEPLAARKSISERDRDLARTEFESAKAGLAEAEAALRAARIDLELTKVKAPITGFASMALQNEGSLISPGAPDSLLTTIHDVDTVQVVFPVSDTQVRRIQSHLASGRAVMDKTIAATLSIDAGQTYPHAGTMVFGNPVISRETGCMLAKARFPNPDKALLPGQVVRVTLDILTFTDAIAVPDHAVLQSRDGAAVVVLSDDDIVSFQPIEVLARVGRFVLVASGLRGDERIVVEGVSKVGPGMKVAPREAGAGEQPAGEARKEG